MSDKQLGVDGLPVRVLVLSNSVLKEASAASFIRQLVCALNETGQVEACLLGRGSRASKLQSYLDFAIRIRQESNRFDVVHSHHGYTIILAWFLTNGRSKRVGTLLSDGLSNFRFGFSLVNRLLLRLVCQVSDALIVRNEATQRMCPGSTIIVSPVSQSKFFIKSRIECLQSIGCEESSRYIGFIISGALDRPEKRYDLYMTVMENLKEKFAPLLINDVSPNEMVSYIGACDYIMLTSDFEGSANCIKESILCGVPVISRPAGDARNILSGVPGCMVLSESELLELRPEEIETLPTRASVRRAAEVRIPSTVAVAKAHVELYRALCGIREDRQP